MRDSADPVLFAFAVAQSFDRHIHKPWRNCFINQDSFTFSFDKTRFRGRKRENPTNKIERMSRTFWVQRLPFHHISIFVPYRVLAMGNSVDCCYNSRWSYQCIFPCIRFCTYTGRRVFYNYDGMEKVQPLVHIYHPRNERVHSLPDAFYGIDDDDDIQNQIKSHKGVYTNICRSKNYKLRLSDWESGTN